MAEIKYAVRFSDGSYGYPTDLWACKQVIAMDPNRRKIVKLTVEDYVPPKKYKWRVVNEYPGDKGSNVTTLGYIYEGISDSREEAEKNSEKFRAFRVGATQKFTIEEIDG